MEKANTNVERSLGWMILLVLLAGCLVVLRPFVSALLWAIVLCYSSWPIYRRVLKFLGNRRTLAALVTALTMILCVLLPFLIVGLTLADNVNELTAAAKRWIEEGPPSPPQWLASVPLIGQQATEHWKTLAADNTKLWEEARRFVEPVGSWLLHVGVSLGGGLMQLTLSIFIAFFLFRDGVATGERLVSAVGRIGGDRGKHLLTVAGNTVRGVVYGILGTALLQAVLAGIGFAIAGVPAAMLLGLLTFFSSVVPAVGTAMVWLPAALWLFHRGQSGWGIFMIIWGVGVGSVDNFVKPLLISRGSDLPFILIFFGVIGGALTFGFIGVFLGPTLLAVGYRLVKEWNTAEVTASPGEAALPKAKSG